MFMHHQTAKWGVLALLASASGCKDKDDGVTASSVSASGSVASAAGRAASTAPERMADQRRVACTVDQQVPEPVLRMPSKGILETFLPPGAALPTFGMDYLVSPSVQVDTLQVELDFDETQVFEPRELKQRCPSAIPAELLSVKVLNDVIAARVIATGPLSERRNDVFYSTGTSSLTVDLTGVTLDSAHTWYFVYEPGWGTERALVMPAPTDARSSYTLHNLPDGPGLLGLVAVDVLSRDPETGFVEAPLGFAAAWAGHHEGWYGALWLEQPTGAVKLTQFVAPGGLLESDVLDEPELTHAAPLLLWAGPRRESGSVKVPCGKIAVQVPSFASVDIGDEGARTTLGPGASSIVPVACAPGQQTTQLTVAASGINGRSARVLLTVKE